MLELSTSVTKRLRPVKNICFLSGMGPDSSGTGQLIRHLHAYNIQNSEFDLFCWSRPKSPGQIVRERNLNYLKDGLKTDYLKGIEFVVDYTRLMAASKRNVVILHPQCLGFEKVIALMKVNSHKLFLYLLDNSFFCIQSYNFVAGETDACVRCLGGKFDEAKTQGCKPFPKSSNLAGKYAKLLYESVKKKEIHLLAQNVMQAQLARAHFGEEALITVVGLWTGEFEKEIVEEKPVEYTSLNKESKYDVVFHGFGVEAKGYKWLIDVAKYSPTKKFLFPFYKPTGVDAPDNCHFEYMEWTTGLKEQIESARYTAVPSLWSAPIEGALVKSIKYARQVLVTQNSYGFAKEIPGGILSVLSNDPVKAGAELAQQSSLEPNWEELNRKKTSFFEGFVRENRCMIDNILKVIDKN